MVDTHAGGGRRRGKARSRILYWFRTPPGVRIGRSALDEDAIRLIEEHNPDVEFDWTRILRSQDSPAESRSSQPDRRSRQRPRDGFTREGPSRPAPVADPGGQTGVRRGSDEGQTGVRPGSDEGQTGVRPLERDDRSNPADLVAQAETVELPDAQIVEEFLAEPRVEPAAPRPQAGDALTAVEGRLGSEGLSRLRARYAEVLARISETITDPERQDELRTQAERLNPDTWVTDAEVKAGLESYESVFESLRTVVGRRKRRRRRSSGRPARGLSADSSSEVPGATATDPGATDDDMDVVDPQKDPSDEQ